MASVLHSICEKDWKERHPISSPARSTIPGERVCCVCNEFTTSGIVFYANSDTVNCRGLHGDFSESC